MQPACATIQALPLTVALGGIAFGAWHLAQDGWRPLALWLIGALLGLVLYHASFGFASGYRRMFVERDMRGVQAQLLLLALTTLLFAPVLAGGSALGRDVGGAWAPVGVSVAVGAFVFGVGMQLAGGCGSGTLYTAGGGSVRMLLVLVAACAGSFWASLHLGWWQRLPAHDAIVLGGTWGWPSAVGLQLLFTAALALILRRLARAAPASPALSSWRTVLTGPWSMVAGAVLLALGNLGTLVVAGHPWSITWGFTLWGAKGALLAGWQPASSPFWQYGGWQREVLAGSVLDDPSR